MSTAVEADRACTRGEESGQRLAGGGLPRTVRAEDRTDRARQRARGPCRARRGRARSRLPTLRPRASARSCDRPAPSPAADDGTAVALPGVAAAMPPDVLGDRVVADAVRAVRSSCRAMFWKMPSGWRASPIAPSPKRIVGTSAARGPRPVARSKGRVNPLSSAGMMRDEQAGDDRARRSADAEQHNTRKPEQAGDRWD